MPTIAVTNRLAKNVSRHKSMAPRPAPPPRGGRVRRVSLLIDLGGGSVGDHHHVRLLVRRLLSHFSRQRPAPRWCVRFYDSGLSPHAFDAKLRARADERAARHAEEEERERNATDSRVHSWVDEHTRETAGVGSLRVASGKDAGARLGGASEAVRATRYRDFGACDANAAEAFLKHHDEAFELYHEHRSSSHRTHSERRPTDRTQTETRGAETAEERVTAAEISARARATIENLETREEKNRPGFSAFVDESGWFTTLARQMAATLQESGSGNGACGVETHAEQDPLAHDVMLVLARANVAPANVAPNTKKGSTNGPSRAAGPSAVALAAATEEKQRENVARAFKGIEAALRKERTVAHLLRLPFEGFPEDPEDPELASRKEKNASGGFSDVSSASVEKRHSEERSRRTETTENERRAFSLATRSAWRRATALFSGFGGCALPSALVAHAAAHVAPCALMAAAADAAAEALEEREKRGASFPTRDENFNAFSSLALALAHDDDHSGDLAYDLVGDGGAAASARVRVREGALETRSSDFPTKTFPTKTKTRRPTTTRRAAEDSPVPVRRTGTTVSLGVAALVPVGDGENDACVENVAAFSRAPRAANDDLVADGEGDAARETSSRTTVTIEALVALDDDTHSFSATFGETHDDSLVLVPRANDDALGGLAALLALRGVAAVAEVTEWTTAKPATTTLTKSENDASADEEELDVMATQEEVDPEAETPVVANRRVALLRPLFARALSLRFVDGPRKEARARAGTNAFPRREKNARFVSGAGAAACALAAAARLGAAEWGCVESIVEKVEEDDIVGARPMLAPSLADALAADAPDHLAARPFAFASSPEYKPARSRGVLALPPGTHPGGSNPAEGNGDRAASVSGGGETFSPRTDLARPIRLDADVSLADAFAEAANAAPAGTHRWEAWYGDGPGVGASVAERFRVYPRTADSSGVLPDASAFSPLRLPAPAVLKTADVEGSFARVEGSRNADAELAARFDAMVSGRPAPSNALPGADAPASPSTLSRDAADSGDADSGSGSVGKTVLNRGGSREGREAASDTLALALVPAEAAPATYPLAVPDVDAADVDAVAARVAAAYAAVASACLGAPADAPDPDAGEAAAALASKAAAAFACALRRGEGGGEGGDEIAAASSAATKRACDLATRALCVTAKDLRASHSGVAGAAAKAAKRREHLLQAHLRLACAALAPAPPSPSASAKLAKTVAKLVGAVTFLLTPVGAEGVRRFVDRELAPRYAAENGSRNSKLIAAVRAELGVGAGADADAAGATPHAQRGGAAAVFSPAAPARPARAGSEPLHTKPAGARVGGTALPIAQAPLPRIPAAEHLHVSHGDVAASARGAARIGPPAAAAAPGAKGWHPVFRSRATRARRQVTMPDPTRAAAERAREAEREVARHTKVLRERAAAAAALIERDGAIGRSRLRAGVGKRVGGETRLASAGQPGSMPAPRRLAREFGSGNDDASATPLSHSDVDVSFGMDRDPERGTRPRRERASSGGGPGGGARGAASRARRGEFCENEKNAFPLPGGLETPAVARTRAAATPVAARGVNARGGSTWLPHGDGLETPAVARTRVAATPVAARGVNTRDRLPLRRATSRVPGSATTTAATPIVRRVAETPAATARAKRETQEKQEKQVTGRKTSEARVSASKRRAGSGKPGLASFGAMVREGRELAETERGGGAKRARR